LVALAVTISHVHRDAVYSQILDRLSGIDDIWMAASSEKFETADRLGREFSDELRLILDDLGWGDGPEVDVIELTTPPDVLRRVFGRLRDKASEERNHREADWAAHQEDEERNRLVGEACQAVLEMLNGGEATR
jgi:hypothetical protein